ncbi:MAG: EF-hand domain-containing protein [Sneathiella sp.]
MKRISIPLALVFSLALPAIVYASMDKGDSGHPRIEKMFEKHDENNDGKITREEMSDGRHNFFEKLDLNKDGAITLQEAKDGHAKMREKHMAKFLMKIDKDSNGSVSEEEFVAFTMEKFNKADKDGDGNLTGDELKDLRHHKRSKKMHN